jgi:hypothetical protein
LCLGRTFAATLGGLVDLTPSKHWKTTEAKQPPGFPTIAFVPDDGRNAELLVTIVPTEVARVSDDVSLRAFHRRLCQPMMSSPHQVLTITDLKLANGIGVYATFEDPSLVGKPAKHGDYKFAIPVAVWLQSKITLHATLFTDSSTGAEATEGLQIIQSAKLTTSHPSASNSATRVSDQPTLRGPDALLTLPSGNFRPTGISRADDPGYFSYADNTGVNLSGWLEKADGYSGFRTFWSHEKAALEKGMGTKVLDEDVKTIGAWSVVSYTLRIGTLVQKHLRACRVEGDTWADLHLSTIVVGGKSADLESVLKRVELKKL